MSVRSSAQPLIVTGMHRSGTSLVASLLRNSGVAVGDRLMPANSGNLRGYFENLDFVEFHERWLRLSGYEPAGWTTLHPIVPSEESTEEALELIRRNERAGSWGWKDPRTTLFLDFWAHLVPNAHYVLLYREPSEVVDSLFRRGDATMMGMPELAVRAWLSHNGMLLRFARANRKRCILANVSVVARDPQRLLRLIKDRFRRREINQDVSSTFESELMKPVDGLDVRAIMVRYLVPECEKLFGELEAEADFAGKIDREAATTAKRARQAFFAAWASARAASALDAQSASDRAATLALFNEKVSHVQTALDSYDEGLAALSLKLQDR